MPDDAKLLQFMGDRVSRALSFTAKLRDTWDENWELWYGYVDTSDRDKWPMRSKVFVPITHAVVETYVSSMLAALLGDEYFYFQPKSPSAVENARAAQRYVNYSLRTDIPYYSTLKEALTINAVFGTGIVKCLWRREYGKIKRYERSFWARLLSLDRYTMSEQKVRIHDCPAITIARLYDTFIEPHATRIEDTPWVIERRIESFDEISRRAEAYKELGWRNMDKLAVLNPVARSGYSDLSEAKHTDSDSEYDKEGPGRKYETLTQWDRETGRVVYAACGGASPSSRTPPSPQIVLYDTENPFDHQELPFAACNCLAVPGSFYGRGWPELLKGLQAIINTQTNQRVDCVTRSLMAPVVCDINDYGDYSGRWKRQPDALWPAENPEAIRTLGMARIPAEAFTEQDHAFEMIQWVSGVTSFQQGMSQSGFNETATGIKLLLQSGAKRLASHVGDVNDTLITRLGSLLLGLYAQFTDEARYMMDDTGEMLTILPEQIVSNKDVNIIPLGSADQADRSGQVAKIIQVMQAVAQIPGAAARIDWGQMVKEVLARADLKDTTRFLIPEPQNLPPPEQTAAQVEAEHAMLSETGTMNPPNGGEDHRNHMLAHMAYGYSPQFQQMPDGARWVLIDHINATSRLLAAEDAQQSGGAGQPTAANIQGASPLEPSPSPDVAEQNMTKADAQNLMRETAAAGG